mmetsp:Transcript_55014/g.167199  ORF Transcript_55014/g.167199 Transcript_55014/m.167199 type:complete len:269 (-) Transcript_55014:910-1716(-)
MQTRPQDADCATGSTHVAEWQSNYFSVICTNGVHASSSSLGILASSSHRPRSSVAGRSPGQSAKNASRAAPAAAKSPRRYKACAAAKSAQNAASARSCLDAAARGQPSGRRATSSKISVAPLRPLTATKSTGRSANASATPAALYTASSTRHPTPYILHKPSRREARLTLSPTSPYFILCLLPKLPASTWPRTMPIRAVIAGRPLAHQRLRREANCSCCSSAAVSAATVCSPSLNWSGGAFHHAMISSPTNSPTTPPCFITMSLMSSR